MNFGGPALFRRFASFKSLLLESTPVYEMRLCFEINLKNLPLPQPISAKICSFFMYGKNCLNSFHSVFLVLEKSSAIKS